MERDILALINKENHKFSAVLRAIVLLPAPEGPSMAMDMGFIP